MFYRRKVVLALLQKFGGSLENTHLQHLLLLYAEMQDKPSFYFVPCQHGCYSFQAAADISTMQKYEQVTVSNIGIKSTVETDFIGQLNEKDRSALKQLHLLHGKKRYADLIKYTYQHFPYYAINSSIAEHYLNSAELRELSELKPSTSKTILYTIGYEGVSLEQYLNKLIERDVKVLVDVRKNPISMKYGFSKSQLLKACEVIGVEYVHFPDVGIVSEERQELWRQVDYDRLFEKYRQETLPHTNSTQEKILQLLKGKQRIALTCFEADICQCHRKHLAEAITRLPEWNYELVHL